MNGQNFHFIFFFKDKCEKQQGFNYLLKDKPGVLVPALVPCLSGFIACNI